MLSNTLLVAARSLRRRIGYTALNVLGLAVGLASAILIGLWVEDELSYDDFHANADRTHRIVSEFNLPDLQTAIAYTPSALAPTMASEIPEVEEAVRTMRSRGVVESKGTRHLETNLLWADPGFLQVFDFPLVRGTNALDRPGTVLLTPKMAEKYFPDTDPIGQTLQMDRPREVTGIIQPPPGHSSVQFDFVLTLKDDPRLQETSWMRNNFRTYAMLEEGASKAAFEEKLAGLVSEYLAPLYERASGNDYPDNGFVLHAQPLTGIHLGQGIPVEIEQTGIDSGASYGNPTYVYLFAALAVFVLLLACINFVNLATARSAERSNEVGVRKALGANRTSLTSQFLGESFLTVGVSLAIGVVLCSLAMPAFNQVAGKSLSSSVLWTPEMLGIYAALLVVLGLAAGTYPAFILGRYRPTDTLRGRGSSSQGSPLLRQALVVFQFGISIALLVGTLTVERQVDHLTSQDLGFNDQNVVVIDHLRQLEGDVQALKQSLAQRASVQQVATAFSVPSGFFINSMWRTDSTGGRERNLNYSFVGPDYADLLEVDLVAGRDFSPDRSTDSSAVVLNRAAAETFGWTPDQALGKTIQNGPDGEKRTVIGVTENFHYESLRESVYPLALFHQQADYQQRHMVVRLQPGQGADGLEDVESTWGEFSTLPIDRSFLADDFAAQYAAEVRLERLFAAFAGLAIFIACLGLFGLAAYSVRQRTREVGIRKALGATVRSVVVLVSKDFLKLVGIAFLVAAPLAYVGMSQWLQGFASRIDLGASLVLAAGLLAFLIATATVSTQAWRAARVDPASALRSE